MTIQSGSRLGPYELTAPIGAGGMGEVYRATDTRLGRQVALKLLPPAFESDAARLARFEREAKLLASLNHPGIAQIYGFERATLPDGTITHLLAMELVEGEDLSARLKRGPIPVDEAIAISRQIAEALEEAHEKGIVHRDLKPGNVKLTPDGRVKVLDFGLAKAWGGEGPGGTSSADLSQSPTLTGTPGAIVGTAAYMSPEQARGKAVDKRADIWAFGVVLYEMLTGRRLFAGETVSDTLASVLRADPDWSRLPPGTPPAVHRLLRRCLDRDVRRRLQAIGEARVALEAGGPSEAAPSDPRRKSARARALPWAVAAAALAAAAWTLLAKGAATTPGPVLHVDVAYPRDVEPDPALEGGFAISPDGRWVAMAGMKDGGRFIFLRWLDTPEAVEVPVSGVGGCAFSPDSTRLAFLASDRVVAVSLRDGQRAVVTEHADLAGGLAWGEAGIVFARGRELWLAPAAGGDARQLTRLEAERQEVLHAGPLLLPGGRFVLFASHASEAGGERIESVPTAGGPRTVVVERATTPVWSPTGHLLFARDGAVLATAFDPATAQVRGAATPVLAQGLLGASVSGALGLRLAENGSLLFLPRDFQAQRVLSVGRDGSSYALDMPRAGYMNPRGSPDGRRVLVNTDGRRLDVLNLERGTRASLTPEAPGTNFPVWSRDGGRVIYRRFNLPVWLSTDGSGRQGDIPGALANDYPSGGGPDPDSVLVTRIQPGTAGDVVLLSLPGSFEPKPLVATPAYEGGAQLSPDGRWMVYSSNASGETEVYVRGYPALDRAWRVSYGGGSQPRWSGNGREIYYRGDGALVAVAFAGSGSEPAIGRPTVLFKDEYDLGQALHAVAEADHPSRLRFFEMYADEAAYKAHIESAHFKKYFETTKGMITSRRLIDTVPILLSAKTK